VKVHLAALYVAGYGDNYNGNPPICGQCQLGCIDGPLVLTPQDVTCKDCLVQMDKALEVGAFRWRRFGNLKFSGFDLMTIPADAAALTRIVFEAQCAVLARLTSSAVAGPTSPG